MIAGNFFLINRSSLGNVPSSSPSRVPPLPLLQQEENPEAGAWDGQLDAQMVGEVWGLYLDHGNPQSYLFLEGFRCN